MRAEQANAEEEAGGKTNTDGTPIEGQAAFWSEQAATCILQSIDILQGSPKMVKIIHALGFSKHPVAVGRALQSTWMPSHCGSGSTGSAVVVGLAQT